MDIIQNIGEIRYLIPRGGLRYYIGRKLVGHGLMSKDKFLASSANARFCKYFENLPESDYEKEIRLQYKTVLRKNPNKYKDNPETFNEKIQWLKVHDVSPLKTRLADKYLVREWIAEQIGEEYLIPLVGGPWKSADEIDFDKLPDRFALKANHGSGMNLVVKDKSKLDIKQTRQLCRTWLNTCFGCIGMEVQYFHMPKVIIAEQYVEDETGFLTDYKIHCFDGHPKIVQVIGGRDFNDHTAHEAFFDTCWKRISMLDHSYGEYENEPTPPICLNEMLHIAEKLSADFKYVRVDLYAIHDSILFGEMTFTPACGNTKWGRDVKLGDMIEL